MAKISAGFAVPVGGELDTAYLQGIGLYRGKEVKKSRLDSDVDFELHPEEPEHEGKSAGSKKGELKLSFLKREKGSFAEGEEELPDFEIRDIVVEGSRRARGIAQATMERVRDAVKLRY